MGNSKAFKIRQRVYEILETASPDDRIAKMVTGFILTLIALNILMLILETVEQIYELAPGLFNLFEIISVVIFTIEYILRIWSCTANNQFGSPLSGRFRFALRPMVMIDLIAILPFYLPMMGLDLRFIRSVRLLRFFRIAKIGRYSKTLQVFGRVMLKTKDQLLTGLFLLLILLIISSSLMYFAERAAQPEVFPNIPASMWWGIVSLTTVGYGDVYPVTIWGKIIASFISILGIGVFALPTGILGAAFVDEIQESKRRKAVCPHCGKSIDNEF